MKNLRVKIEEPHMDYYSSSEHSSDPGEEANHLNYHMLGIRKRIAIYKRMADFSHTPETVNRR